MLAVLTVPRQDLGGASLGEALMRTHSSYLSAFRALREAATIRSIAHLTGGGWEGNLPRALPEGLGAIIDRTAWRVPAIFEVLADLGRVPDDDQWDTWNMGIGVVVIVPEADAAAALRAVPEAAVVGRVERVRRDERRIRFA
jgi:phosphoribosylformylglycinamidine cyclo-ligase